MKDKLQQVYDYYINMVNPSKIEKFQVPSISTSDFLLFSLTYFIFIGFYLYVTIYGGKQAFDSLFSFSNWTYYIAAIVILYTIAYNVKQDIAPVSTSFVIICMILYVRFVQNKQLCLL